MNKQIIFISHLSEEAHLAGLIKEFINEKFMGLFDIFVSSDGASISSGSRWLEEITSALEKSVVQLSLCSHESIKRPWINFEAGASWIRKIPVVPICHSGLRKNNLPIPLALLQSCEIDDANDLQKLFTLLASKIDAQLPPIDFAPFIENCRISMEHCALRYEIRRSVSRVSKFLPDVGKCLMTGEPVSISFVCRDSFIREFHESVKIFEDNNFIALSDDDSVMLMQDATEGMFGITMQMTLLSDYEPVRLKIFETR